MYAHSTKIEREREECLQILQKNKLIIFKTNAPC